MHAFEARGPSEALETAMRDVRLWHLLSPRLPERQLREPTGAVPGR